MHIQSSAVKTWTCLHISSWSCLLLGQYASYGHLPKGVPILFYIYSTPTTAPAKCRVSTHDHVDPGHHDIDKTHGRIHHHCYCVHPRLRHREASLHYNITSKRHRSIYLRITPSIRSLGRTLQIPRANTKNKYFGIPDIRHAQAT